MTKLSTRILALCCGAALLTGCGATGETPTPSTKDAATQSSDATSSDATSDAATPTPDATTGDAATPTTALLALDAVDAALAHTPGAVVELDRERRQWEVLVLADDGSGVELYLNIETGVVEQERPAALDTHQRTAPTVTAAEAIGFALTEKPGEVWELELGTERSTTVWEVTVMADAGGQWEIDLDAATGAIVGAKQDH